MEIFWFSGGIVLAVVGIASVAVGLRLAVGVAGVVADLRSEVRAIRTDLETVDRRITSEVKARASSAALDARKQDQTIEQEAAQILASQNLNSGSKKRARPSVITGR